MISDLARVAAVLVAIVGLIGSWYISSELGVLGPNPIVTFLVLFLFFASLAMLLWLVAAISDQVTNR